MTEILLINPRTDDRQRPPLGLAYIASILEKENLKVAIFDALPNPNNPKKIIEIIKEKNIKLIGITTTTTQLHETNNLAKEIKENNSETIIIVGGPHATAKTKEMMQTSNIDIIVMGEGEQTSKELFTKLIKNQPITDVKGICYKKNNEIIINPPRELIENLDTIPFPSRDLLDNGWYHKRGSLIRGTWKKTATIITSRGCPGRCTYCSAHDTFGRKIRQRTVKNVIKEIKELVEKYDVEALSFCDDTLTTNNEWVREFCEELRKLKREMNKKIVWSCQSRVNTVTQELLNEMKRSGCLQIEFGCESGSQKILDVLKKNITVNQIRRAFEMSKRAGLRTMANFVIGNPEETKEDIMMTAELSKKLGADWVEFFITTPYPGSELYDVAEKNGWIKRGYNNNVWRHDHSSENPVMEINFTGEEILELRGELYSSFVGNIFRSTMTLSFLLDFVRFFLINIRGVVKDIKSMFIELGFKTERKMRGVKKDVVF